VQNTKEKKRINHTRKAKGAQAPIIINKNIKEKKDIKKNSADTRGIAKKTGRNPHS